MKRLVMLLAIMASASVHAMDPKLAIYKKGLEASLQDREPKSKPKANARSTADANKVSTNPADLSVGLLASSFSCPKRKRVRATKVTPEQPQDPKKDEGENGVEGRELAIVRAANTQPNVQQDSPIELSITQRTFAAIKSLASNATSLPKAMLNQIFNPTSAADLAGLASGSNPAAQPLQGALGGTPRLNTSLNTGDGGTSSPSVPRLISDNNNEEDEDSEGNETETPEPYVAPNGDLHTNPEEQDPILDNVIDPGLQENDQQKTNTDAGSSTTSGQTGSTDQVSNQQPSVPAQPWITPGRLALGGGAVVGLAVVGKCAAWLFSSPAQREIRVLSDLLDPKNSENKAFERLVATLKIVPQNEIRAKRAEGRLALEKYIGEWAATLQQKHAETSLKERIISGLQSDYACLKEAKTAFTCALKKIWTQKK